MPRSFRPILAATLGLLALGSIARAQAPRAPMTGPEAQARLDALIASYRALPAYADHGSVTLVVKVGDRELKQSQRASIAFARPNRVDVRTELVRVIADGTNLTTVVAPLRKYSVAPVPKKLAETTLRGGPLGSIEFGGLAGLPLVHVLNFVIGDDPRRLIEDFTPRVLLEGDQQVDRVAYQVLRLDESDNHDWRFLIDPKTGLIAYIDLVVEGDATRSSIAGGATHVESLRWASGAVSTEVPPAETFAFQPEAGYSRLGLAEKPAEAKAEPPVAPLVGKPAPAFSVDVLDGPDRFRKVGPADLLGKVVLIDFWATWCGPCLAELPDIQTLIEGYGRDKKDVAVLALSIDQSEAGDLKEARGKVEAKLQEMKLSLAAEGGTPVGLVGLDPLGKVAELYAVQAIPFVVLVDPKGIIRAVHVGVTPRDVLAAEVEDLLAGRPIGR